MQSFSAAKRACELNMRDHEQHQLLSGLEMQAILDQRSVKEAEVGLGRGENLSSLQHYCRVLYN